jgi:hypothetical protein
MGKTFPFKDIKEKHAQSLILSHKINPKKESEVKKTTPNKKNTYQRRYLHFNINTPLLHFN